MGLIGGTKRLITDNVNDLARNSAYKVMKKATQATYDSFLDMTPKEINKLGHMTAGAVKYGIYGATGAGDNSGIDLGEFLGKHPVIGLGTAAVGGGIISNMLDDDNDE